MGAGGEKRPMKEIAETKAAAKEEAFNAIIEKVKMAGGEIVVMKHLFLQKVHRS